MTGRDVLRLEGMRFFGHHGCLADERGAGVHLDVDVELRPTPARRRATTGSRTPSTTRGSSRRAGGWSRSSSYHLVETVAERLAEELLDEPRAVSVVVRVAKRPPLAAAVDRFSVTVERRRA